MKRIWIIIVLFITLFLFSAGCTDEQKQTAVAAGGSDFPAPPDDIAVHAQINEKDPIDSTITVIFSGGSGQNMVKHAYAIVTYENGETLTKDLKAEKLAEVTFEGSKGTDNVRVYADYYNGNTYKIAEKNLVYKSRAGDVK